MGPAQVSRSQLFLEMQRVKVLCLRVRKGDQEARHHGWLRPSGTKLSYPVQVRVNGNLDGGSLITDYRRFGIKLQPNITSR